MTQHSTANLTIPSSTVPFPLVLKHVTAGEAVAYLSERLRMSEKGQCRSFHIVTQKSLTSVDLLHVLPN